MIVIPEIFSFTAPPSPLPDALAPEGGICPYDPYIHIFHAHIRTWSQCRINDIDGRHLQKKKSIINPTRILWCMMLFDLIFFSYIRCQCAFTFQYSRIKSASNYMPNFHPCPLSNQLSPDRRRDPSHWPYIYIYHAHIIILKRALTLMPLNSKSKRCNFLAWACHLPRQLLKIFLIFFNYNIWLHQEQSIEINCDTFWIQW
jgi:hypothetical protein